ncbi:MAG: DUF1295 domain-containing protein [Anaerolineales bacterium]|nr:DUF1295 domain-containing protein [Anaerolineales bacterium]
MGGLIDIGVTAGLGIWIGVTFVWALSLFLEDASIMDPAWGFGFVAVAWYAQLAAGGAREPRDLILLGAVSLWGLRLGGYLTWRRWGEPEDKRYRRWRHQAGPSWWWKSYFKVFLLQGFLMWVISAPLVAAAVTSATALNWLDAVAGILWLLGFATESLADWQLARFKSDPANRGELLTEGLWRYSRHPNYFGETLQWWAFYGFAVAAGAWYTVFSPLLMTFLILRVSGVPILERDLSDAKPGYEDYARRTPAFVPWFPREISGHTGNQD